MEFVALHAGLGSKNDECRFGWIADNLPLTLIFRYRGGRAQNTTCNSSTVGCILRDIDRAMWCIAAPFHRIRMRWCRHSDDRHLIFGERTCLIRTNHRGRTQRLNRWKTSDDCLALGHAMHADGKDDGDSSRQTFRYRANAERNGSHHCIGKRIATKQRNAYRHGSNNECDTQQQHAEPLNTSRNWRLDVDGLR